MFSEHTTWYTKYNQAKHAGKGVQGSPLVGRGVPPHFSLSLQGCVIVLREREKLFSLFGTQWRAHDVHTF
jgi:hypothetical protein